jgi:glutathione S-transferase
MLRYVASLDETKALYPDDPLHRLRVDEVIGLLDDLQRAWTPSYLIGRDPALLLHKQLSEEQKQELVREAREKFVAEELPKYLTFIARWLDQSDGQFLCGPEPTIADCQALPQLRYFTRGVADHVPITCLDTHPEVPDYINRMLAHPKVKAYYDAIEAQKSQN